METVKTAISLQKSLFDEAEKLAVKLGVSRSKLFAMALEDYIHRGQNASLLKRINEAYDEEPDAAEQRLHKHARQSHRRLLEGDW
jgi:metal-responsive CopG/Arc/MetJ family transcriptional regulator